MPFTSSWLLSGLPGTSARRSRRSASGTPRPARRRCRASVVTCSPSMKTGQFGDSPVPGSEMPMFAAFDSPGPFTTQPITATDIVSTPGCRGFHTGIIVAHVLLNALGQLLERRRRRPAAAGAGGDRRRERAQAERLQDLARGVHLFAPIAAGPRRERHANRVADAFVQQNRQRRRRPRDALHAHAGFGEAEVQRLIRLLREVAIDGDQIARPRDLARNDDLILP